MLRNLMEDKRLDFDAPLISVRRFSAPPEAAPAPVSAAAPPEAGESGRGRRSSLPFYKSDLKSGPVRDPGVVPFFWEQTPGLPKDGPRPPGRPPAVPKLPPARISREKSARTRRSVPSAPPIASSVVFSDSSIAEKVREEVKEEKQPPPPAACNEEDDDDDEFTDALDTLSRTESFFMNCSVSGISGIPDAGEAIPLTGSFATDPLVRDFMMGRFLPAAQAAAASSPQCAPRKPVRFVEREESGEYRRLPVPQPYRYGDNFVSQFARGQEEDGDVYIEEVDDDVDYDDDDDDDAGHFSSKACGLLPRFCLKSSFCLLNPVPGMKARRRVPLSSGRRNGSPQLRTSLHEPLGAAEGENSWEAVYKHKLGSGDQHPAEAESKLTSESNRLTNWSDSQTADGSSPYRHSVGGAVSPYRNEVFPSAFCEGKSFLGVPRRERMALRTDGSGSGSGSFEKDGDNYLDLPHHDGSLQGPGSMSPTIEKTVYVDTVRSPEAPCSELISVGTNAEVSQISEPDYNNANTGGMQKPVVKYCEIGVISQIMDESIILEICEKNELQPKVSELVEPDLPNCSERSDFQNMDESNSSKHKDSDDYLAPLKTKDQAKNNSGFVSSLLPPPLPKSPTESWLYRALPSVSSKNPPQQSFLGIKFQPKKQAFHATSTDSKQEKIGKPVKQQRQIRFADMLTKPLSPESEI